MAALQPLSSAPGRILALIAMFAVAVTVLTGNSPLLAIASLLLLAVLGKLLWRPGEPPVLLYAMTYHWVQASVLIFYGGFEGDLLQSLADRAAMESATWLTLMGILVVSLGMRLGAGMNRAPLLRPAPAAIAALLSVERLFYASLLAIVFANVIVLFVPIVPTLRQLLLAVANFHWVIVYLLTYAVISGKRGYRELGIVFGVEFIIGLLGFFGEFKTIFVILILASLTSSTALLSFRRKTSIVIAAMAIATGLVWTTVKSDYRSFLNQGTGAQVVLVSVGDRIENLIDLLAEVSLERVGESVDAFLRRLSYVQYFAESIQMVPDVIPYENGTLWGEAIINSLVPRFVDPSKPDISDSVRTSYYTGKVVSGVEAGTSIGLGYMAESYIDFGPVLMVVPLFLWGLTVGWMYRTLIGVTRYPLLGYGCATVLIILGASLLETSNSKMVGGVALHFLVFYLISKYGAGWFFAKVARPVDTREFDYGI